MMHENTIYFDSAATTFKKPQSIFEACDDALRNYSANSGRGGYAIAIKSAEKIFMCRELIGKMFNAQPENVIFTFNTTYALNMAVNGIISDGCHILMSDIEHNSVYRPIHAKMKEGRIKYNIFKTHKNGVYSSELTLKSIKQLINKDTKALFSIHHSNISSCVLPIREIGRICKENNILFIVDAAQSAGHIDIDMKRDNIDILCLPSHKGLYGPQGIGIMILQNTAKNLVKPSIFGGSGVNSLSPFMPQEPPERYEAGTLPTEIIAGLYEGIKEINNIGLKNIREHEEYMYSLIYERLSKNKKIKIYGDEKGSVLLFNILGIPSDNVGEYLASKNIAVRTGYHCAPLAHKALETYKDSKHGAVRVSFDIFNTKDEAEYLCKQVLSFANGI